VRRTPQPSPRGVLEVDWPFFGEICRALALRVAREYQPEIVLGIAKAGVIPGVVVASILQCDFASMVVTRQEEGAQPMLVERAPTAGEHAREVYPREDPRRRAKLLVAQELPAASRQSGLPRCSLSSASSRFFFPTFLLTPALVANSLLSCTSFPMGQTTAGTMRGTPRATGWTVLICALCLIGTAAAELHLQS
jgi:hypothetical protein